MTNTCVTCQRTADEGAMWTVEIRVTSKRTEERTFCNRCELEYRRERATRTTARSDA